ncbi:hypothetical protein C0J52_17986 [Blattella germanica]|nr:hypothetical protein C0J52_17986 [Blattella germanica]
MNNIEEEGESKVAGTYCVYTEVEPDREEIILGGPLKQDLAVYILYNGAENPGIHVEYSCPLNASVSGNLVNSKQVQEAKGTSHEAKQSVSHWDNSCSDNSTGTNASKQVAHKYHWELVDWGPCSAFCGGGTQISQPSCIDESGGKVALKYCQNVTKPEGTARVCNDQPCKTRWRTSEWSKCDGCVERPGTRKRLVECVKESPIADSVVIVDDKDCHQEKPVDQESCTSKEPCNTTDTSEAKGHEQNYEVNSKKPETGTEDKDLNECENVNNENTMSNNKAKNKTGSIVIDTIPPEKIKVIQMPLIKDSKQFNMSDEAVESIGDSVPSLVDVCKAKEATGEEALKQLLETKKKNEEKTEKEENKKYDELTLEDKNTSSNTIETKDSDSCETTTIDLECGDSEFSTSFEGTTSMSTSTVESQDKKGFKFSSLFGLPSIQNGVDKIERNDMKEIKKDIQLNEPLGLKDKNNKRGNVRDLKVKAKFEKNERISSPAKNKYEHIEGRERSSKNHVDSGKDDTKVKEEVENVEDEKMSELNENKNDPKVKELEEGEEESKESRMPVLRKSNDIGKANNGKKLKREEFKNMVKSNIGTKKLNYEKFSDRVESKYNSKIPAGKETKFSKFLSRRDFKEDPNTQDAGKAIKDSKFSEGSENKDESKVREVSKETKLPSWKDNKEDVKYNGGVKCEHFSREDKVAKREGKEGGKGTRLKDELKGKEEIQEATKLEKGIELQQFQGKDSYEMRKRCEQECKDEDCDQECDEECDKDCENDCDNCQNECEDEDEDDCGKECENECGQECKKDCGNDCQKECGKECIKECLNKYKNQT